MSQLHNQFHKLSSLGVEGLKLGVSTLQSFPMTSIAIMVIRSQLAEEIEIGIFEPGSEIIHQGEKGLDIYMILDSDVDVTVNDQLLVTMPSPNVIGEKALIQKDNTRSASILIAGENPGMVLKIPMGLFLKEFDHAEIPDSFYIREKKIYLGLFIQIQKRLFHYVKLQNTNYTILHNTVQNLNTRWLAIIFGQCADKGWGKEVFEHLKPFVALRFGFKAKGEFPITIEPFLKELKLHFIKKYPKSNFNNSEEQFKAIQKNVWSQWLHQMAAHILPVVPTSALAYDLQEVPLVDLSAYRTKILNYIKNLERNFPKIKQAPLQEDLKQCFERGSSAGKFNLKQFQTIVSDRYVVKYPKRVDASMGKSLALIAADTENQFNNSISIIKKHLEHIDKLELVFKHVKQKDPKNYARNLTILQESFAHFLKGALGGHSKDQIGEITFNTANCPNLENLLNSSGTQERKDQISNACYNLIQDVGLCHSSIPHGLFEFQIHYAKALPDFKINPASLAEHYWVPLSDGIKLVKEGQYLDTLAKGNILGGKAYAQQDQGQIQIQAPPRDAEGPVEQDALFLVIRDPLQINQAQPDKQIQWMDWLIEQHLSEISVISKEKEETYAEYNHLVRTYQRDSQILQFERGELDIPKEAQINILHYLKSFLGYTQDATEFVSLELTTKVQDFITAKEPAIVEGADIEQRQKHIFTQWRFALVNMIDLIEVEQETGDFNEAPAVLQLHEELKELLIEHKIEKTEHFLEIQDDSLTIKLPSLFRKLDLKHPELIQVYQKLSLIVESTLLKLRVDVSELEKKLVDLVKQGDTLVVEEDLQKQVIAGLASKLEGLFMQQYAELEEESEQDTETNAEAKDERKNKETSAEDTAPQTEAPEETKETQ